MTTRLRTPFGTELTLRRYPVRERELLQAWDAADELLLSHLAEHAEALGLPGRKVLIVGDAFGALSAALTEFSPTAYTDSFLAARAIAMNAEGRVPVLDRFAELRGPYDLVLARIPKNLSFFEDTLAHLGPHLSAGAKLIAGVRVKYLTASAFDLIAKYFGETSTSLAKKKARLVFAEFSRATLPSPYPLSLSVPGFADPFINHSNVFSRGKLDVGTRFFLDHIPAGGFRTIVDLACGNGILGIAAHRKHPRAKLIFTDESRMALLSAEENLRKSAPDADAEFHWTNGYEEGVPNSADLVLCNPPFHQENTVGDFVAREMFRDAYRVLASGGRLRVIGNTHLHYPELLRRRFGNAAVIATNAKFTIAEATKP
jgi:16S rRNA (guanine1207-N2)-methyltransferase